jgi:hypothetical protein
VPPRYSYRELVEDEEEFEITEEELELPEEELTWFTELDEPEDEVEEETLFPE